MLLETGGIDEASPVGYPEIKVGPRGEPCHPDIAYDLSAVYPFADPDAPGVP
ncbi:MAG: hypothetical protein MZU95_09635 [Desulfomicrobium escambiense]|nr:hypothetical protein [Desulfomicrobium escambiense]